MNLLAMLASQQAPLGSFYLYISSVGVLVRHELFHLADFRWVLGFQTHILLLVRQALSSLSPLSYPLPLEYLKRSGSLWRIMVRVRPVRRMIRNYLV